MKEPKEGFFSALFDRFKYKQNDIIFIKQKAIITKPVSMRLLKVEVIQRRLTGYVVVDADEFQYFVRFWHVVTKQ